MARKSDSSFPVHRAELPLSSLWSGFPPSFPFYSSSSVQYLLYSTLSQLHFINNQEKIVYKRWDKFSENRRFYCPSMSGEEGCTAEYARINLACNTMENKQYNLKQFLKMKLVIYSVLNELWKIKSHNGYQEWMNEHWNFCHQ